MGLIRGSGRKSSAIEVLFRCTGELGSVKCSTAVVAYYSLYKDVWVSNRARDRLIASRASSGHEPGKGSPEKPVMVIDNEGIPHGFIIGNVGTMHSLDLP